MAFTFSHEIQESQFIDQILIRVHAVSHVHKGSREEIKRHLLQAIEILQNETLLDREKAKHVKERLGLSNPASLFHLALRNTQGFFEIEKTISKQQIKRLPEEFQEYIEGPGLISQ